MTWALKGWQYYSAVVAKVVGSIPHVAEIKFWSHTTLIHNNVNQLAI